MAETFLPWRIDGCACHEQLFCAQNFYDLVFRGSSWAGSVDPMMMGSLSMKATAREIKSPSKPPSRVRSTDIAPSVFIILGNEPFFRVARAADCNELSLC